MLAKKPKQPEPSLLDRLHAFRAELDAFIEQKTMEQKNSRDGASLFTGDIRHMLTRGDHCLCRAVARLLGDPDA
jgi:hypothetical protein